MMDKTIAVTTDVRRTINERTGVTFLLHTQSGRCYTLNHLATYVWQRLSGGASPTAIANDVARATKRAPEVVAADIESFVSELVSSGLARVA